MLRPRASEILPTPICAVPFACTAAPPNAVMDEMKAQSWISRTFRGLLTKSGQCASLRTIGTLYLDMNCFRTQKKSQTKESLGTTAKILHVGRVLDTHASLTSRVPWHRPKQREVNASQHPNGLTDADPYQPEESRPERRKAPRRLKRTSCVNYKQSIRSIGSHEPETHLLSLEGAEG